MPLISIAAELREAYSSSRFWGKSAGRSASPRLVGPAADSDPDLAFARDGITAGLWRHQATLGMTKSCDRPCSVETISCRARSCRAKFSTSFVPRPPRRLSARRLHAHVRCR